MTRYAAYGLLLALCTAVSAQPPAAAPVPVAEPSKPLTVVLTVSPAAAPVPALRYELLPRLRDSTPGNAALDYNRATLVKPAWPRDMAKGREQDEMIQKWEEAATDQFPVAEVRKFLAAYAGSFRCLDQAVRCNRCDWEMTRNFHGDTIGLLLPDVQAHRELTRFHKLRIRADIAENKFDDAIHNLQTGYRLAKDVGEGPTLIQMLVGLALGAVFTGEVDQLVQRPGAPNLYWALTSLPRPLIDFKPALEGEALLFENFFPNLREFEKGPVSAERANVMLEEMLGAFQRFNGDDPGVVALVAKVGLTTYVALHYQEAKKQLVAAGRPADVVEKMPPAQIVALRSLGVYRAMADDQQKCFALPYPQARAELAKARERTKKLVAANADDLLAKLFSLLLPAMDKVFEAHARFERRLAGLRVVEAIRMHAAANGGLPPKSLADVVVVPVPDDPNTGKPFEYAADGNTFTLTAPPPAKEEPTLGNSFRYEVTVRGK